VPVQLRGSVQWTTTPPSLLWELYSGPGTARFSDPGNLASTVEFRHAGTYTLRLSARDGVHAPAYDAVEIQVEEGIRLRIRPSGQSIVLEWEGGTPPFVLERTDSLLSGSWDAVLTTQTREAVVALSSSSFYRVGGN
jgi:hypothetical protein